MSDRFDDLCASLQIDALHRTNVYWPVLALGEFSDAGGHGLILRSVAPASPGDPIEMDCVVPDWRRDLALNLGPTDARPGDARLALDGAAARNALLHA